MGPAEHVKGAPNMAIGPVQLLVLGFSQPDFHGEIIAELERLRESDLVRVIDPLAVSHVCERADSIPDFPLLRSASCLLGLKMLRILQSLV